MIPADGDAGHWLFLTAGALFGVGVLASLWRLFVGPTLPDRVVALDAMGFFVVAIIIVYAIVTNSSPLLAVGLVAALILFIGTAGFAIYLERRGAS